MFDYIIYNNHFKYYYIILCSDIFNTLLHVSKGDSERDTGNHLGKLETGNSKSICVRLEINIIKKITPPPLVTENHRIAY